jgi:hypothetical protein
MRKEMQEFEIVKWTFDFTIRATSQQKRDIESLRLGIAVIDYCEDRGIEYSRDPVINYSSHIMDSELVSNEN